MSLRIPRAFTALCALILAGMAAAAAAEPYPDKSTPPEAVTLSPPAAPVARTGAAETAIQEMVALVNDDSIYNFIGHLSGQFPIDLSYGTRTIRTRYTGTPGNRHGRDYIKQVLESYGYQAVIQYFGFNLSLQAVHVRPGGVAVAAGQDVCVIRNDTGESWRGIEEGTDTLAGTIRDVAWVGGEAYVFVGNSGLCLTTDETGEVLTPRATGTAERLDGVAVLASGVGWAVGRAGTILKTVDGGQTWAAQTSGVADFLRSVHAFDDQTAVAVGDGGVILRTVDGGQVWTPVASGTTSALNDLCFLGAFGCAVGAGGVVQTTGDGGQTWTPGSSGTSQALLGVSFTDALHGFAVGDAGTLLRTDDGGQAWSAQSSPWTIGWRAVAAASSDEAWAVGLGGHIIHTTDGGANWIDVDSTIFAGPANVYATKPGTTHPEQEVVLLGHFDSISGAYSETLAPGAEDNGSGVAAVVEAARIMKGVDFERTVTFLAVDQEEIGLIGSDAFAHVASAEGRDLVAVVNFDMIGWDDSYLRIVSNDNSIWLGDLILACGAAYVPGLNLAHIYCPTCAWSDHASFWPYGFSAVTGIESWDNGAPPQYHTPWDTLGLVNIPYNRDCAKLGLATVATAAGVDTAVTTGVRDGDIPERAPVTLGPAEPNPFNPTTTIRFTLAEAGRVEIAVFNASGRRVRSLIDEPREAGHHSVVWTGVDDGGRPAPSGVYFYRMEAGRFTETRKMVLIR